MHHNMHNNNKTIKDEVDAVGLDGDIHIHINCSSYHLKVKPSIFHFHKTGAMTVGIKIHFLCFKGLQKVSLEPTFIKESKISYVSQDPISNI